MMNLIELCMQNLSFGYLSFGCALTAAGHRAPGSS
jgi:hypothetical protein